MYPQREVDVIVDMSWYNIFVVFCGFLSSVSSDNVGVRFLVHII